MKGEVFALDGKKTRSMELPPQCTAEFRPDLIKRAFLAYQSHNRQPSGAYRKAGQRSSAVLSRRRRRYRGSYGHGISRVPRKALWKRGRQFGWVGAFAPGMVSGRRAHPPKAQKVLEHKINKQERRKALCSAITATFNEGIVKRRGHKFEFLPSIVESNIEALSKTKEVEKLLNSLKLEKELERAGVKKVRAGKGKRRNRKYKTKKGPLFVVSRECSLLKAAGNIAGVDACIVDKLNVNLLAPGGHPGRLTVYSEDAIKRLADHHLFLASRKVEGEKTKPRQQGVKQKQGEKHTKQAAPKQRGKKT